MSYILDALRKADAERERDPARGIHAQPAAPQAASAPASRWVIGVGGAGLVAAMVAAWFMFGRDQPQPPAVPVAVAPAPAVLSAPPASPTPPPPRPVADTVQPAPPPMPMPVIAAPAARPGGITSSIVATPVTPSAVASAAQGATVPAALPPAPTASKPAGASTADRILAAAELPPDVQRELPKITITGGVHSDNAAQRMLIVGGQVMSEGSEVAPGLVLEQVRPKTAVLRWRQWRYSVAY